MTEKQNRFRSREDIEATFDRKTGNTIVNLFTKPVSPLVIDIKVSSRCNGGCPFCYQNATPEGGEADCDYVIQGLESLPVAPFSVALGGGEPTLWGDCSHLIYHCEDLRINAALTVGPGALKNNDYILLSVISQEENLKAIGISYTGDQRDFLDRVFSCEGKGYVHLVLFRDKLEEYGRLFDSHWWPDELQGVVLLLPKNVGRGVGIDQIPSRAEIQAFVDKHVVPWFNWYEGTRSVSADPCLGSDLTGRSQLVMSGCDGGMYSMYWDAVKKKIGRCSFLQDELVPWDGTRGEFERIWASWDRPVNCKFALR
jgi:hypothetical protein